MNRRHVMPFGAEPNADGRMRFRLWAPSAHRVDLVLQGRGEALAMHAVGDGWFERVTGEARHGSRYRFRIDGGMEVPDPASRYNPEDVHGPSEVIDPTAFSWDDPGWKGRPWHEAVIYELHVGTFTPEGTFAGVQSRLDYLEDLGITAIELMPVADFAGKRNWGYDGVLPFAPDSSYGRPDDLKSLVQAAHQRGLMVFLDVVYNHFGPEGNYLHAYCPAFFTERHHTPWGAAINFDGEGSRTVRDFFIHNALFWLEEYHFDGLRLDAVHAILDDTRPDILIELAQAARNGPGKDRSIHLVLENDRNQARYLERHPSSSRHGEALPRWYDAQWNDDIHHGLHVLLTGEADGYYSDYTENTGQPLGRSLAEGFAYQGESSPFRQGEKRGEPSGHLPATAFVSFLQNHDQVGNRAYGERLTSLAGEAALKTATGVLLLAPSPPLLFMGEEFAAATPFLYFCDFEPVLGAAVSEGRRSEFARFAKFSDPMTRAAIPDPEDPETFRRSRIDWDCLQRPPHDAWLEFFRRLLRVRRESIIPRLPGLQVGSAGFEIVGAAALTAWWSFSDGARLRLAANLSGSAQSGMPVPRGELLWASDRDVPAALHAGQVPPWSSAWFIEGNGKQ